MNKPAHTPGPWAVEHLSSPVYGSNGALMANGFGIGAQSAHIATVLKQNNVTLIAAAPELLEALKAASEWLNDMGCEHEQPDLRCVVCLVNVAINKAEGRG